MNNKWYFVLLLILIFIVYCLPNTNKNISINSFNNIYSFKSSDIPYIPDKMELKYKDNKVARHLKFRFVYTCPDKIYENIKERIDKNVNIDLDEKFSIIGSTSQNMF